MYVCLHAHVLSPGSPKELHNVHVQNQQDGPFIKWLNRKPGELTLLTHLKLSLKPWNTRPRTENTLKLCFKIIKKKMLLWLFFNNKSKFGSIEMQICIFSANYSWNICRTLYQNLTFFCLKRPFFEDEAKEKCCLFSGFLNDVSICVVLAFHQNKIRLPFQNQQRTETPLILYSN